MPLRRAGLWVAFVAVHAWLTYLGVVVAGARAFYDVDLYRWWVGLALDSGQWPVLDTPWVYPVGALVPMLVPALVTTVSTAGYALGWCVMVTVLDAIALLVLTSASASTSMSAPTSASERSGARLAGAWWWLGFLVLLGPVALGRLDAIVAPIMIVALVLTTRSARGSRLAATVLTVGAWIKVAPGALLIPLAAAARRPGRTVVLPAALVCVVVLVGVAAGGGIGRVAGFLTEQQGRGLQVESVAATPWVLGALVRDDIVIALNEALITYEVTGPGTTTAARVLDIALVLGVAAVGLAVLMARRRGTADAAVLPATLTLLAVLIAANKVGSPQFLTWLAAPLAVLLATGPTPRPRWVRAAAILGLVAAGLTQVVFPWGYPSLLNGEVPVTLALAARNLVLLALLGCAAVGLSAATGAGRRRHSGADVAGPAAPPPQPSPGATSRATRSRWSRSARSSTWR